MSMGSKRNILRKKRFREAKKAGVETARRRRSGWTKRRTEKSERSSGETKKGNVIDGRVMDRKRGWRADLQS
jgi:hypothetical protein